MVFERRTQEIVRGAAKAVSVVLLRQVPIMLQIKQEGRTEATGLFSEREIEAIMEAAVDENRRAARAAGSYKDDSRSNDPSRTVSQVLVT